MDIDDCSNNSVMEIDVLVKEDGMEVDFQEEMDVDNELRINGRHPMIDFSENGLNVTPFEVVNKQNSQVPSVETTKHFPNNDLNDEQSDLGKAVLSQECTNSALDEKETNEHDNDSLECDHVNNETGNKDEVTSSVMCNETNNTDGVTSNTNEENSENVDLLDGDVFGDLNKLQLGDVTSTEEEGFHANSANQEVPSPTNEIAASIGSTNTDTVSQNMTAGLDDSQENVGNIENISGNDSYHSESTINGLVFTNESLRDLENSQENDGNVESTSGNDASSEQPSINGLASTNESPTDLDNLLNNTSKDLLDSQDSSDKVESSVSALIEDRLSSKNDEKRIDEESELHEDPSSKNEDCCNNESIETDNACVNRIEIERSSNLESENTAKLSHHSELNHSNNKEQNAAAEVDESASSTTLDSSLNESRSTVCSIDITIRKEYEDILGKSTDEDSDTSNPSQLLNCDETSCEKMKTPQVVINNDLEMESNALENATTESNKEYESRNPENVEERCEATTESNLEASEKLNDIENMEIDELLQEKTKQLETEEQMDVDLEDIGNLDEEMTETSDQSFGDNNPSLNVGMEDKDNAEQNTCDNRESIQTEMENVTSTENNDSDITNPKVPKKSVSIENNDHASELQNKTDETCRRESVLNLKEVAEDVSGRDNVENVGNDKSGNEEIAEERCNMESCPAENLGDKRNIEELVFGHSGTLESDESEAVIPNIIATTTIAPTEFENIRCEEIAEENQFAEFEIPKLSILTQNYIKLNLVAAAMQNTNQSSNYEMVEEPRHPLNIHIKEELMLETDESHEMGDPIVAFQNVDSLNTKKRSKRRRPIWNYTKPKQKKKPPRKKPGEGEITSQNAQRSASSIRKSLRRPISTVTKSLGSLDRSSLKRVVNPIKRYGDLEYSASQYEAVKQQSNTSQVAKPNEVKKPDEVSSNPAEAKEKVVLLHSQKEKVTPSHSQKEKVTSQNQKEKVTSSNSQKVVKKSKPPDKNPPKKSNPRPASKPANSTEKSSKKPKLVPADSAKEVPAKSRNVAVKSTTTIKHPNPSPVKIRNIAVKRGKPHYTKPGPKKKQETVQIGVFVDTGFGNRNTDMFINENEDEDDGYIVKKNSPNNKTKRSDSDKRKRTTSELKSCNVEITRMPFIDKLLPAKKEEKIEPNICELCDPKRIFLSKKSYTDHINSEHFSGVVEASLSATPEPVVEKVNDTCAFCNKKFHSRNRLSLHMKECQREKTANIKDESPAKTKPPNASISITNIPGINLSKLGKNITISLKSAEKKAEDKKAEDKKAEDTTSITKHVCTICQRKFLMPAGLSSHMKTHMLPDVKLTPSKSGKLMCHICDKVFRFGSELFEHISFHSLTSDREKDILSSNLNKISNVEVKTIRTVIEYESSSDVSSNYSEDSIDYDFCKIDRPKIDFTPNKCTECGRLFTIKSIYERHLSLISKTKDLEDRTKCPICDVEFKILCKLGAHLETHKPRAEEQLLCQKCNKTFRCENNLIRHQLEHEGKLRVNCQYCNVTFNSMTDLYSHQDDCKLKCSEYKCNSCKRVFTAKWRLDLHMKTDEKHGTDPQQPNLYFCDQCGREFRHLSVLKRHVDSRCGTEPLYECTDCDKKYFSQGSLASHKRTQHSTEKNYMCQYCSKDFFTKHQLHRHELRHNPDVRPYRCKYPNCEKTYRQPDSLRAHECEHTGFYPYACEFCGVQFSNVKSLKLHRKSSNHWSQVEPNKVVTQACRRRNGSRKKTECKTSEDEAQEEPKNLVVNGSHYDGIYGGERIPAHAPTQYSALQPFTVNHLMQHNQHQSLIVQSSYSQAIENYFVIAAQQEPLTSGHHPLMN